MRSPGLDLKELQSVGLALLRATLWLALRQFSLPPVVLQVPEFLARQGFCVNCCPSEVTWSMWWSWARGKTDRTCFGSRQVGRTSDCKEKLAYREKGNQPRRKAPPPRWTDPALVQAAPALARQMEVEEKEKERERVHVLGYPSS